MVTDPKHINSLDGVRAGAVLLVVVYHFWDIFHGPAGIVGKLMTWGQTGVPLFFVLSGFLITGILVDSREARFYFRDFYARRTLRIFPLYYLTLIAYYLVVPLLGLRHFVPVSEQWWFWVYLQNIPLTFHLPYDGPAHFWSLAVEEHFYLLWPILVRRLERRRLLLVLGVAVAISFVSRIVLFQHYEIFYFTLCRLDGLAVGSALAIFARSAGGLESKTRAAIYTLIATLPLVVLMQFLQGKVPGALLASANGVLIALMHGSMIVLVVTKKFGQLVESALTNVFARSIGKYSYAIYVIHPFVMFGMARYGFRYSLPAFMLCCCAIYLASFLSWVLVEKHFLALKRYFAPKIPATALNDLVGRQPVL